MRGQTQPLRRNGAPQSGGTSANLPRDTTWRFWWAQAEVAVLSGSIIDLKIGRLLGSKEACARKFTSAVWRARSAGFSHWQTQEAGAAFLFSPLWQTTQLFFFASFKVALVLFWRHLALFLYFAVVSSVSHNLFQTLPQSYSQSALSEKTWTAALHKSFLFFFLYWCWTFSRWHHSESPVLLCNALFLCTLPLLYWPNSGLFVCSRRDFLTNSFRVSSCLFSARKPQLSDFNVLVYFKCWKVIWKISNHHQWLWGGRLSQSLCEHSIPGQWLTASVMSRIFSRSRWDPVVTERKSTQFTSDPWPTSPA